jgi:ABC-type amino acid transport substrate-binding protein
VYEKQIPSASLYHETQEQYGLAMQKGKVLNEKISKALEEMIRDGEVKEILARNL